MSGTHNHSVNGQINLAFIRFSDNASINMMTIHSSMRTSKYYFFEVHQLYVYSICARLQSGLHKKRNPRNPRNPVTGTKSTA